MAMILGKDFAIVIYGWYLFLKMLLQVARSAMVASRCAAGAQRRAHTDIASVHSRVFAIALYNNHRQGLQRRAVAYSRR